MFQRSYLTSLRNRLTGPRAFIQVLMGPRQIGKTTMVKQLLSDYNNEWHYASADEANSPVWLQQQWDILRLKYSKTGAKEALLVIDEIQRIHDWARYIKIQWDKDSFANVNIKVVILGSSQLMIQKGLSESLAGRFEVTYLPHWSYSEMQECFGLTVEEYTWFGGYPGSASLIHDEPRWKEYVLQSLIETTIMKDIVMMVRVDKPALLHNLFELGCQYSGQILSYTKILGQLVDAGNTTTLAHYLKLMEGAGMLKGLEKYSGSKIRQRSSSPKYQVFNNALLSAQSGFSFDEMKHRPDLSGRWIESIIGSHLVNRSMSEDTKVQYWRELNNEIDFVLIKSDTIIGIEVKSGHSKPKAGLSKFVEEFHPFRVFIVGQDGIPVEEFLTLSLSELF